MFTKIHRRWGATATALITAMGLAGATLASAAPPDNDNFADATELTLGVEQRWNINDATGEVDETFCDGLKTVWFKFTAPKAGDYVGYRTGSNTDSHGGWFSDISTDIDCSDDDSISYDGSSTATFAEGQTLYYQVSHYESGETNAYGQGGVGVARALSPTDTFADAPALTFASGSAVAARAVRSVDTMTSEVGEPFDCGAHSFFEQSAWMKFTPPTTRSWMFERKSYEDGDIAVYTGNSVDDLTLLGCSAYDSDDRPAFALQLTAGTEYMIQVTSDDDSDPVVVRAEPVAIRSTMTVLDDGSAASSTDMGAGSAAIVKSDGLPAVAYVDNDNGALVFASRALDGTWTSSLVTTSGTPDADELDLIEFADGTFGVFYYDRDGRELRMSSGTPGDWEDGGVDDTGSGASTDVGTSPNARVLSDGTVAVVYDDDDADELHIAWLAPDDTMGRQAIPLDSGVNPSLGKNAFVEDADGTVHVVYTDLNNYQIRMASSADLSTWTDQEIFTSAYDTLNPPVMGVAPDGDLWIVFEQNISGLMVAHRTGESWSIQQDDASHNVAELASEELVDILFDDAGYPMIVWLDGNQEGGGAVSRLTSGGWRIEDLLGLGLAPGDAGFDGTKGLNSGSAILLPGDELLVFAQYDGSDNDPMMVVLEDALDADAATAAASPAARAVALDGSSSSDAWGSIVSYQWTAPDLCTISGSTSAKASIHCVEPTTAPARLTVTDQDGNTSWTDVALDFGAPECETTADPFTDVPGSSYADKSVTCIYNLGVTTGITPTIYDLKSDVTREQMAAFMTRLYETMTGTTCATPSVPFTDMPGNFADDPIRCIYGLGVTTGTSATTYAPKDLVTREQMAAFLGRLWAAVHEDNAPIVSTPFTDVSPTSYARDHIGRIYGLEITTGTSPTTYAPAANVTREQMAAFLARFYEAVIA